MLHNALLKDFESECDVIVIALLDERSKRAEWKGEKWRQAERELSMMRGENEGTIRVCR